jgi:hypothetical protein
MAGLLLELLMPTLESRTAKREAILASLNGQVERYRLANTVAVRCYQDNGEAALGAKRNSLLFAATARYVAFLDDDDRVVHDYVPCLVEAIYGHQGVDVVTFRTKRTVDGDEATAETLIYDLNQPTVTAEPSTIQLMPPNHLCAWRTDIAQRMEFPEDLAYGSDQVWWKALLLAGAARTQRHIPRTLYHYDYCRDNDGVPHDGTRVRESQRAMGPEWRRSVYRDIETGVLFAGPESAGPEGTEFIGEVQLS